MSIRFSLAAVLTGMVGLTLLAILATVSLSNAQGGRPSDPQRVSTTSTTTAPEEQTTRKWQLEVYLVDEDDLANAATRKILDKVGIADFDDVPFNKILEKLSKDSGVSIVANWTVLEQAGIKMDCKITLHIKNKSYKTCLRILLEIAGGVTPVTYVVQDGVVKVSTAENLAMTRVTRIYDVREILANDQLETSGKEVEAGAKRLAKELMNSVASDSWKTSDPEVDFNWGGGEVNFIGGNLIVTQSMDIQDEVAEYLSRIREGAVAPWKEEIRRKIQVKMDVALDNVKLEDALKIVREKAGVNLAVDPMFKRMGLPEITLTLKNVTAQQVLGMLTDMTRTKALLKNGAIYVTTPEISAPETTKPSSRPAVTVDTLK